MKDVNRNDGTFSLGFCVLKSKRAMTLQHTPKDSEPSPVGTAHSWMSKAQDQLSDQVFLVRVYPNTVEGICESVID